MTDPEKMVLEISYDPKTGGVQVHGPIGNKLFCFGLLEMAKMVIKDFNVEKSQIIKPILVLPKDMGKDKP